MKQEFLKNKEKIEDWLNKYQITNYTLILNEKYGYIVDVDNNVWLRKLNLHWIPIKFNIIKGFFNCSENFLTSLEFCPQKVDDDFICSFNQLKNLEYSPNEIGGDFCCYNNFLTSLKGCPEKINGDFWCYVNKLTSLEFCPKEIDGIFDCSNNLIENLLYFPQKITNSCFMTNAKLGDLQNITDFNVLYQLHLDIKNRKELYEGLNDSIDEENKIIRKNKI